MRSGHLDRGAHRPGVPLNLVDRQLGWRGSALHVQLVVRCVCECVCVARRSCSGWVKQSDWRLCNRAGVVPPRMRPGHLDRGAYRPGVPFNWEGLQSDRRGLALRVQ
jgi:hypothetical protein